MTDAFRECASCASKPGTPTLCDPCLRRREEHYGQTDETVNEGRIIRGAALVTSTWFHPSFDPRVDDLRDFFAGNADALAYLDAVEAISSSDMMEPDTR